MRQEICYLHPSEGALGMPKVEMRCHTLCLTFLDWMCSQDMAAGSFWKEDAKQSFPSLRSVHSADRETHHLPRRECSFYHKCRHTFKVHSWLQTGLSDSWPLSCRALYRCLVRGAASDGLIGELGVTEVEGCLLWPWAPGMRCLNNDEASLTWLVIRNALGVGKKLFSVQQAISPECSRCSDLEESIDSFIGQCARFLKVTWFASSMESSSFWKPVLCAAMLYRG